MARVLAQAASVAVPQALSVQKSSFLGSAQNAKPLAVSNGSRVVAFAGGPGENWLPGNPRPAWLDGSLPGDFGFDPIGLGKVPENLDRFTESELIHGRWAMLGVAGSLLPEILGLGNWVDAQQWISTPGGQGTYFGTELPWATLPLILSINSVLTFGAEAQRLNNPDPVKRKYPGGPFDPLGFAKDSSKLGEWKLKEIKNGRLAMLAFFGFSVQAAVYPGTGPVENLLTHLANPWGANIADKLILPIL